MLGLHLVLLTLHVRYTISIKQDNMYLVTINPISSVDRWLEYLESTLGTDAFKILDCFILSYI